jgi:hypothetical protein
MVGGLVGGMFSYPELKELLEQRGLTWFAAGTIATLVTVTEVAGYYALMWRIGTQIVY